jgi:small subunit ribosomal protein S17
VQDLQGKVVSVKMQRSCVVAVERLAPVDKYMKRVRITKNFIAHNDGSLEVSEGDIVRLEGVRPLSKQKRFKVAEIVRKAY